MSYFRGRPMRWNPDRQVIEQERQRWVMEKLVSANELITAEAIDPDQAYAVHRKAYEDTGDLSQLALALEYVR